MFQLILKSNALLKSCSWAVACSISCLLFDVENGFGIDNGPFIGDWISINLSALVQSVAWKVGKYFTNVACWCLVLLSLWNRITTALQENYSCCINIQAKHNSIEWRKDDEWLCMYVHKHWRKLVCTCLKTCCNALLVRIVCLLKSNVGRFSFLHTPIWVDVTAYFQLISCVCSIHVCQAALELYRIKWELQYTYVY